MKATFKKKRDLDETSLAFPLVSSDMSSKALGLRLQKPGHLSSLTLELQDYPPCGVKAANWLMRDYKV